MCIGLNVSREAREVRKENLLFFLSGLCALCGEASAFTGGDSDNLMVGRNGVFYDCKGNDWDATIVKIIDHPISVSQAFWAPYKRIARMIGG